MDGLKLSRIIACGLLLFAIIKLPHGYYFFLRVVITVIAGINAYFVFKEDNKVLFIVFLVIVILFNPFIPIHFNKSTWILIDLITGFFFGVIAFLPRNNEDDKKIS